MISKPFYNFFFFVKLENMFNNNMRNQCVTHKLLLVEPEIMFNK